MLAQLEDNSSYRASKRDRKQCAAKWGRVGSFANRFRQAIDTSTVYRLCSTSGLRSVTRVVIVVSPLIALIHSLIGNTLLFITFRSSTSLELLNINSFICLCLVPRNARILISAGTNYLPEGQPHYFE